MENIILTNNKDLRLVGVKVGVLSTLRFELPLVSASATHVEVIVTSGNVHSAYTATFIDATKRWQCDIAASQFPAVGRQSYEIAYVLDGKQFWDGKGWIDIADATTSGIEPQPRPEPYRYAVVSVNGYGADAQGAARIPKTFITTDSPETTEGYIEGDICFNRETGATWTLCNVQGTLTWVFNYKNYYTKAETEEAIERVAAYYITADAQGNPFATHAALVNAQTYYSGGAVRTPTRNDYAVVSADETHGGAEWRYIYAVDAQGAGQWEPQYAVEGVIAYDNTVTRTSANGVKSSGIWSAIWGALSALPTGFSSLYDWCVAQLAGKASTADATLTPIYSYSEWEVEPATATINGLTIPLFVFDKESGGVRYWWLSSSSTSGSPMDFTLYDPTATSLTFTLPNGFSPSSVVATRTRTALPGYILGPDDPSNPNRDKLLASEAEAEALRTGKLDKAAVVAPSTSSADSGKAADAKATGDALALIAPDWVQTSAYSAYDCVKYNGAYYYAKQAIANSTIAPSSDTTHWGSLANLAAVVKKFLPLTGGTITGDFELSNPAYPHYKFHIDADGIGELLIVSDGFPPLIQPFTLRFPIASGTLALTAGPNHTGNLAALDADGNPTDSGIKPSDKLNATSAAPAFSTSSTYSVGDHVTYNGALYRCTTAVSTAGAWTGDTNWTADTMTDPDAVLDVTAQNQLRVVAKDGTLLWAQGYDLASTSSATLACDAVNNFTFADGATTQAFALPTAPSGKVGDFGLDIDNSDNTGAATLTLTGLDTTFSVVVPEGESLTDMLAIAAGELARFYVTLTTFRVNNLPTWHIVKQVVENGGATV